MKNLIDHLKETLEEEKKKIVGYIKLRDEFMLDWIDNIDCMDYYDSSIYDAAYLKWYEAAIRHAEHYNDTRQQSDMPNTIHWY